MGECQGELAVPRLSVTAEPRQSTVPASLHRYTDSILPAKPGRAGSRACQQTPLNVILKGKQEPDGD